jgi:hypothetical protein
MKVIFDHVHNDRRTVAYMRRGRGRMTDDVGPSKSHAYQTVYELEALKDERAPPDSSVKLVTDHGGTEPPRLVAAMASTHR